MGECCHVQPYGFYDIFSCIYKAVFISCLLISFTQVKQSRSEKLIYLCVNSLNYGKMLSLCLVYECVLIFKKVPS